VHAALHPKRELWIAWSTTAAIVGQRLVPGFLDRYLATRAWDSQTTERLPPGHPRTHELDDVDAPIPGDKGAHGPFDLVARTRSTKLWARTYGGWLAAAGAAATMVLLWKPLTRALWGDR
jgi:hypothetical protein